MMPDFFAGEVKFPIRQSCGENTKIGLRTRRQLDGEKAIYQDISKLSNYQNYTSTRSLARGPPISNVHAHTLGVCACA